MHQFAELAHCRHLQGKLQTILYLKCTSVCTYFSAFIFASDVFAVSANIPWDVKTSICTQMSQWQKIDAQQQKKADVEPCVVRKKKLFLRFLGTEPDSKSGYAICYFYGMDVT